MRKIFFLVLCFCVSQVFAVNKWWKPTSGNTYNTAANFSPSGVPATGDTLIFDGDSSTANMTLNITTNTLSGLIVKSNYTGIVTIGGNFVVCKPSKPNYLSIKGGKFTATSGALLIDNDVSDSVVIDVDSINTSPITFRNQSVSAKNIYTFQSNLKTLQTIFVGLTNDASGKYNLNSSAITMYGANGLEIRSQTAGKAFTCTLNCNSATITTPKFFTTSTGTLNFAMNMGSSSWLLSGDWNFNAKYSINPGTSRVKFTGSTNSTITSSNNSFYDVIDSLNANTKLTLADSLTTQRDLLIKSGKFFTTGFNLNIGGDLLMSGADTSNLSTSRITLTKRGATWTQTSTGVRLGGGASIVAPLGMVFVRDSNGVFYNIKIGDQCRLGLTAGKTLKDSTYTAGDLEGTSLSVRDTISSNSSESQATFDLPANTPLSYDVIKDIAFVNTVYCTTGCYNGGNVTNAVWDSIKVSAISPASVLTTGGSACTLTTLRGRTSGGSVSVGVTSATITSQAADKIIFTTPTKSNGTYKIYASNGNGLIDSSQSLTYAGGPEITTSPQSATDTIGSTHTFTVTATGSGALSYQWRRKLASGAWGNVGTNSDTYTTGTLARVDTNSLYAVLVTDENGTTASDTATLTVSLFPPVISYAASPAVCSTGVRYTHPMTNSGFAIDSAVATGLVPGVTIDRSTGTITIYTDTTRTKFAVQIIAYNSSGQDTAYDTITINQGVPVISYTRNPAKYKPDAAIATNAMLNAAGGALDSVTVSPALPTGLSINASTGAITGTPTAKTARATYTVTAYNAVGGGTVGLVLTVGVDSQQGGISRAFRGGGYRGSAWRGGAYR